MCDYENCVKRHRSEGHGRTCEAQSSGETRAFYKGAGVISRDIRLEMAFLSGSSTPWAEVEDGAGGSWLKELKALGLYFSPSPSAVTTE